MYNGFFSTLSVECTAKESDIPSLDALFLLAQEQDGGRVSRKGKSERRSRRWKSKPLSRQCRGHKWPFQVDSGKSYFCLC